MIYPPWLKIAVPLVIAAIIFGAGWKVQGWRCSSKVTKAEEKAARFEKERDEAIAFRDGCIKDVARIKADMEADKQALKEANDRYLEAVSKPPEVVVKYRDRYHTVTETVVSEDCNEGLGQLWAWLQTLPAYQKEVPDAGP